MEAGYSFLLISFLIILNGTFVAAEFAIARLRKTRIDQIAESNEYSKGKKAAAQVLQKILRQINDYISACQVGITISSLALGAVAEARLEKMIAPYIANLNLGIDTHVISITLALFIATFLHVIIGEVVPKNIAIINAERVAFNLVYFLRFLYLLFKIPVKMLNFVSNICLHILGIDSNITDDVHTEDELKMILSSSQAQGVLEEEEEQLIQNVFQFNDTIARDVMIPRGDMVAIEAGVSIEEGGKIANNSSFSRFPVFKQRLDQVIGYVTIKEILKAYQSGKVAENIESISTDILKVPDGIYVIDLLQQMQEKKKQIAILIDEFGGVSGLVTAEDIVEEIFGEIEDEDEVEEEEQIKSLNDNSWLVDGLVNLKIVNEELGTNFISEHYDTMGGFVFGLIGAEPKAGDKVNYNGHVLEVEKHEKNRVKRVKISSS